MIVGTHDEWVKLADELHHFLESLAQHPLVDPTTGPGAKVLHDFMVSLSSVGVFNPISPEGNPTIFITCQCCIQYRVIWSEELQRYYVETERGDGVKRQTVFGTTETGPKELKEVKVVATKPLNDAARSPELPSSVRKVQDTKPPRHRKRRSKVS